MIGKKIDKKSNMYRKAYCPKDSDFNHYYASQTGSGFSDIRIVRAPRYQQGYGFGSFFGRLALPLIKYLGKEALNKGVNIGKRVVQDPKIQEAFKEGVKDLAAKGLKKLNQKFEGQEGSGKKRLYKKKRVTKSKKSLLKVKKRALKKASKKRKVSKKRDIFN